MFLSYSFLSYILFLNAAYLQYSPTSLTSSLSSWSHPALPVFNEYCSMIHSLKSFYFTPYFLDNFYYIILQISNVLMISKCAFVSIIHFHIYLFFSNKFPDSLSKYPSKNLIHIKPVLPLMLPIFLDRSSILITYLEN